MRHTLRSSPFFAVLTNRATIREATNPIGSNDEGSSLTERTITEGRVSDGVQGEPK